MANIEHLAEKGFVLVTIKAVVQPLAKGLPSGQRQLGGDGLVPDCCRTLHVMLNQTNPKGGVDCVCGEVLFTQRTPTFWVFAIEGGERQFRKTTSQRIGAVIVRKSNLMLKKLLWRKVIWWNLLWKLWLRRMIWGMLWLGVIVLLWRRSLVDEIGQGRWRVGVEIGSWRMMNQFWSRSWWNHNRRWTKIGSMNTRGTGSKRTLVGIWVQVVATLEPKSHVVVSTQCPLGIVAVRPAAEAATVAAAGEEG